MTGVSDRSVRTIGFMATPHIAVMTTTMFALDMSVAGAQAALNVVRVMSRRLSSR
jgi:hypothetical protein